MKIHIYTSIVLLNVFLINSSYGESLNCELLEGFESYECMEENYCNKTFGDLDKIIVKTEEFKDVKKYKKDSSFAYLLSTQPELFAINSAKKVYKENMGKIYKCGVIEAQIRSYKLMRKLLQSDKTGALKRNIRKRIDTKVNQLKITSGTNKCKAEKDFSKKTVLDQTIYQTCKYRYYLKYAEKYSLDYEKLLGSEAVQKYTPQYITYLENNVKYAVQEEVEHTMKIYPVVFQAYSEYESHFLIHIMLELIKEDLTIFREKFHKVINPINQVVYKISNAMKLD